MHIHTWSHPSMHIPLRILTLIYTHNRREAQIRASSCIHRRTTWSRVFCISRSVYVGYAEGRRRGFLSCRAKWSNTGSFARFKS